MFEYHALITSLARLFLDAAKRRVLLTLLSPADSILP